MKTITRDELKKKLAAGEGIVLDVLSAQHFSEEHVPGAINIPLKELEAKAAEALPDKNAEIIVYCASFECTASSTAAQKLEELGYTNVVEYEGGIKDWKEGNNKTEGTLAE